MPLVDPVTTAVLPVNVAICQLLLSLHPLQGIVVVGRQFIHRHGLAGRRRLDVAVADQTLFVPRTDWILQPIVAIVPLQLLAYYIAREKGLNVDQPRNLAKTVTVE